MCSLKKIARYGGLRINTSIIILVNKSEIPKNQKQFKEKDVENFSEKWNIPCIEVSSKNHKSLLSAFTKIVEYMLGDLQRIGLFGYRRASIAGGVTLTSSMSEQRGNSKSCCK